MCGIEGFFSGCDLAQDDHAILADACIHCSRFANYRTVFDKWDERASVRSKPRRILSGEFNDASALALPVELVPILRHPAVRRRGVPTMRNLSIHHLYRYLNFTTVLESLVVGRTMTRFALGQLWEKPPETLVMDAQRICVDEAYHALFSVDMHQQVRRATQMRHLDYDPSFMRALKSLRGDLRKDELRLADLYFVIISETLVTGFLKRESQLAPDAIAGTIHDHLKDEMLHHAFFRQVLFEIWPELTHRERDLLRRLTRPFILAFLMPDLPMMRSELVAEGFDERQARNILMDTYTSDYVDAHIVNSTKALQHYLRRIGIDEINFFSASQFDLGTANNDSAWSN
jgi:hypothetical protein